MINAVNLTAFKDAEAYDYVSAMAEIVTIAKRNGFIVTGGSNCCGCSTCYISFETGRGTDEYDYDELEVD